MDTGPLTPAPEQPRQRFWKWARGCPVPAALAPHHTATQLTADRESREWLRVSHCCEKSPALFINNQTCRVICCFVTS